MGFKTGIVGLPNVGKSTLFNALTKTAAAQQFRAVSPQTIPKFALDLPRFAFGLRDRIRCINGRTHLRRSGLDCPDQTAASHR